MGIVICIVGWCSWLIFHGSSVEPRDLPVRPIVDLLVLSLRVLIDQAVAHPLGAQIGSHDITRPTPLQRIMPGLCLCPLLVIHIFISILRHVDILKSLARVVPVFQWRLRLLQRGDGVVRSMTLSLPFVLVIAIVLAALVVLHVLVDALDVVVYFLDLVLHGD